MDGIGVKMARVLSARRCDIGCGTVAVSRSIRWLVIFALLWGSDGHAAPTDGAALMDFLRFEVEHPQQAQGRGATLLATQAAQDDPIFAREVLGIMGHAAVVSRDSAAVVDDIGRLEALSVGKNFLSAHAYALILQGDEASEKGDIKERSRLAMEGAQILASSSDPELTARAEDELCSMHTDIDDTDLAQIHCRAALAAFTKLKDSSSLGLIDAYRLYGLYEAVGTLERDQGHLDIAVTLTEQAYRGDIEIGVPSMATLIGDTLGTMYTEQGLPEKALPLQRKALELEIVKGLRGDEILTRENMVRTLSKLGRNQEALQQLDQAIAIGEGNNTDSHLIDLLIMKADLAKDTGNTAEALDASLRANHLSQKRTDEETTHKLAEFEAKYTSLQKEQELEQLKEQQREHELRLKAEQAENARQRLILVLASVALVALAALTTMLYWLLRTQKRNARRLWLISRIDPLTGANNRSVFLKSVEAAFKTAEQDHRPAALLAVDIDRFKTVNDEFGHLAGDRVLTDITDAMRRVLPDGAIMGRLGGDEFAVLLAESDLSVALRVAETMRVAAEACTERGDGVYAMLSASIGVAIFDGMNYGSIEQWIDAADGELYAAKRAGRNRVHPTTSTEYEVQTASRTADA